jgi:hypothetical protein
MIEHQFYDFNNLITNKDRITMCNDVRTLIDNGQYWKNSPKFQTDVQVFGLPGEQWTKLKMSFVWACFAFLKKEVQIKGVQSWSFMTSNKYPEPRDMLWHHHHHNKDVQSVSGVYYLKVPVNKKQCGTEFAPDGPESPARVMLPPKEGQWVIYNSREWHRPGELMSDKDRFIVAADMMY